MIVFFDGVCNLCNFFVDWLIVRDQRGELRFASLQSVVAQEYLKKYKTDVSLSTVVVFDGEQILIKSKAVISVIEKLGGIYFVLAKVLQLFPLFLTDKIYDLIALKRYQIFGQRNTCRVPSAQERSRFLD